MKVPRLFSSLIQYDLSNSVAETNLDVGPYGPPSALCMSLMADRTLSFFDLTEACRPLVDRKVLEFVKGHVFDPADFFIRSDGVCRLNPEMARGVVGLI
jgi:CRISP-associated protein Cas1